MIQTPDTKYQRLNTRDPFVADTAPAGGPARTDVLDVPQVMTRGPSFSSEVTHGACRQALELEAVVIAPSKVVSDLHALAETDAVCAVRRVLAALEVRHGQPYCIELENGLLLGKNRFLAKTGEQADGAPRWSRLSASRFKRPGDRSDAICAAVVKRISEVIEAGIEAAAKPLGNNPELERRMEAYGRDAASLECDATGCCIWACCFPLLGYCKAVELGIWLCNRA